jgi:8-oxo-dGTP pyrophosphatase MutT (NUDIX family)
MHITPELLAPVEARFGRPVEEAITVAIGPEEMQMVVASTRGQTRIHDVTVFAVNPAGRIACIRKPSFPPGGFRAPSGGVKVGEDLEQGVLRELWEETGVTARLERYLLRVTATFTCPGFPPQPWRTHVFSATCPDHTTVVHDTKEVAEAAFLTLDELLGPVRQRLAATGRGLLAYRIWLTDRVGELLAPAIAQLAAAACQGGGPLSK